VAAWLALRHKPSLRRLRAIELIVLGVACAFLAGWQLRWYYGGLLPEFTGSERAAVLLAGGSLTFPWLVVLLVYGIGIPNTARRCAAVVAGVALLPVLLTVAAALHSPALRPYLLLDFLLGNLLPWLALAGAIAVYGAHRLGSLRREAFAARELGQYRLKRQLGA